MISPEFLFFCALGLFAVANAMRMGDKDRREARRRNPRTWDDRT